MCGRITPAATRCARRKRATPCSARSRRRSAGSYELQASIPASTHLPRWRARTSPRRQSPDLRADLRGGNTNVVCGLQIEPELRARAEPMAEAQRRISGHCALALNDLGDPVRRHSDLPRQFGRRDGKLVQLVGQNLAGMNRRSCHGFHSLVIIDNLDIRRPASSARPFKTYPPLIIDADAELAGAIALQGLQSVAPQCPQLVEACGSIQNFEPAIGLPREPLKLPDEPAFGKRRSPFLPVA